jgi:hypothetical protein
VGFGDLDDGRVLQGAGVLALAEKVMPPIGDQAWVTMPCSALNACTSGCWK